MTGIVIQSIILYIAGVAFGYLCYQAVRKILFKLKGATTTNHYIYNILLWHHNIAYDYRLYILI